MSQIRYADQCDHTTCKGRSEPNQEGQMVFGGWICKCPCHHTPNPTARDYTPHDCEYISDPETGKCDFCYEKADAIESAIQKEMSETKTYMELSVLQAKEIARLNGEVERAVILLKEIACDLGVQVCDIEQFINRFRFSKHLKPEDWSGGDAKTYEV